MTSHSIDGKAVLIAGGAKNLGGLIARDFAAQGARAVAIHYNSPSAAADAEATVAAIKAAHLLNDAAVTAAFAALKDGVTEREIQALAAKYLRPEKDWSLVVVPEKKAN